MLRHNKVIDYFEIVRSFFYTSTIQIFIHTFTLLSFFFLTFIVYQFLIYLVSTPLLEYCAWFQPVITFTVATASYSGTWSRLMIFLLIRTVIFSILHFPSVGVFRFWWMVLLFLSIQRSMSPFTSIFLWRSL